MDYSADIADIVASRILISYWWSPDTPCFGDRRHCGRNEAHYRSRGVGGGIGSNNLIFLDV